jgi:hypothetical protein
MRIPQNARAVTRKPDKRDGRVSLK